MTKYRDEMVKFTNMARDESADVVRVAMINYSPSLIDMGQRMDELVAENERLQAIVNLIDLKEDRDRLAARVEELEDEAIANDLNASAGA